MKTKGIFAIFMMTALFIAGCATTPAPSVPGNFDNEGLMGNKEIEDNTFKSIEEYQTFLKDNDAGGGYGAYYSSRGGVMMEDAKSVVPTALSSTGNGESVNEYSMTNNQVAGVDEADMLKTDGEFIYTLTEKTLFIVKAVPGDESEVVSTIKFEDYPSALFVEEDTLAVIGSVTDFEFLNDKGFSRNQGYVFVNIYDISDRENPILEKELKYEGQYNNARLIGSQMYLVSTFYPQYRDSPMPIIFEGAMQKDFGVENIHYFNIPYSNPSLVVVNSINLESMTTTDSQAFTIDGYPNMFMSKENIYLTYTEYINEWELQQDIMMDIIVPKLSEQDRAFITKVQNTDSDILSTYEKQNKIMQVVQSYFSSLPQEEMDNLQDEIDGELKAKLAEFEYMEYTIINKISVDNGNINLEANGKVPGHILNQFSMDEFEGNFRIAITIQERYSRFRDEVATLEIASDDVVSSKIASMPAWNSNTMNNVYVLDSKLKIIGEIEGLGEGEQIYSVRFMGDRAYVVTFRQTDPFYVLDLENPSSPKMLGELKIPGFSRYLHPYDENTIIGIGRDATEAGRQQGLKISLFDVSDVENPKEIAKYVTDDQYSSSYAEWEHKAFLFSKEKELMVIPIYSYNYDDGENMNGALVFKITKEDIALRGLIDHGENTMYGAGVERSLFINDLLYTKSPRLIRVNDLGDLSSVANVTLSVNGVSSVPRY